MAYPDWQDVGKRVEVTFDNGSTIQGELIAEEQFFTGEEEIPLLEIKMDNGEVVDFPVFDDWRFIPDI